MPITTFLRCISEGVLWGLVSTNGWWRWTHPLYISYREIASRTTYYNDNNTIWPDTKKRIGFTCWRFDILDQLHVRLPIRREPRKQFNSGQPGYNSFVWWYRIPRLQKMRILSDIKKISSISVREDAKHQITILKRNHVTDRIVRHIIKYLGTEVGNTYCQFLEASSG